MNDGRRQEQIPTKVIIRAAVVMFLSRLGSLNALEQTSGSGFWRRWLGGPLPSADSVGRVCSSVDVDGPRAVMHRVYAKLKRMKALAPPPHGLMLAVVDGHETTASRKRCCPQCRQRTIHTKKGDVTEFYHRYTVLRLVGRSGSMMLDAEPMLPGEDEVASARRLVERAVDAYPRAFDVVAGDAAYATTEWFRFLRSRGKQALAVLKDNRPNLLDDARTLFGFLPGTECSTDQGDRVKRWYWDSDRFESWPDVASHVRVVRHLEITYVRRQLNKQIEEKQSDWMWVTTLSPRQASARAVADMGHERWSIENQGFNELANRWHADHIYKHHPTAMLVLFLLSMICLNVLEAFYTRNLQPSARACATMLHISRQIAAELYVGLPSGAPQAPT